MRRKLRWQEVVYGVVAIFFVLWMIVQTMIDGRISE
jgi:hypothetical protein